jgi:hypothetical protein
MTGREDRNARNQQESLGALMAQKVEFDALVAELKQMSDEHFGAAPEAVLWGEVGTLEHWNSRLRQVTDCYFRRGEFAE